MKAEKIPLPLSFKRDRQRKNHRKALLATYLGALSLRGGNTTWAVPTADKQNRSECHWQALHPCTCHRAALAAFDGSSAGRPLRRHRCAPKVTRSRSGWRGVGAELVGSTSTSRCRSTRRRGSEQRRRR